MKVFIIGAAGKLGQRLSAILVAQGDAVTGMHRGPDQAEAVEGTGAASLVADLVEVSADELAAMTAGHDAVVFSAGAHGTGRDLTTLIDGKGAQKAAEAAEQAGASRFVLVSAFRDSERGGALGDAYEHYIRTKRDAEIHLTRTALDWIIVRPGHMLDGVGTGRVSAGPALREDDVSRADVADFIAEALRAPKLSRTIVELTDGTTPIPDAVRRVASSIGPRRRSAGEGASESTPAQDG